MQKHSNHQHRSDMGLPLLAAIIIGLFFFGAYLAVERLSVGALPSLGPWKAGAKGKYRY